MFALFGIEDTTALLRPLLVPFSEEIITGFEISTLFPESRRTELASPSQADALKTPPNHKTADIIPTAWTARMMPLVFRKFSSLIILSASYSIRRLAPDEILAAFHASRACILSK